MSTVLTNPKPIENQVQSQNHFESYQGDQSKYHPIDFYALGKVDNQVQSTTFYRTNMGTQDKSADLLNRNYFSVRNEAFEPLRANFKVCKTLNEQSKETNNYMAPLTNYKTMERFHLPLNMTNVETYNIAKEKLFANDRSSSLQNGTKLSKKDFIREKEQSMTSKQLPLPGTVAFDNKKLSSTKGEMKDNVLVFDKTRTHMLRNKGFWIPRLIAQNKTKISKEAPEWFDVIPESKVKEFQEHLIQNEDTISVFSRYQNWITVNPKSMDRRHPLEKMKAKNMEQTSKIMPKWMEIKQYPNLNKQDCLKSTEYSSMKNKSKKMMVWVDKDLNNKKRIDNTSDGVCHNNTRSIFSSGDFRHNLLTKEQARYYDTKVSQMPKKFFDWDDGKKFNPKYKTDQ